MVLGIGTDILRIDRIFPKALKDNDPFLNKSFTQAEKTEAGVRLNPKDYYASRFVAKEAVYKAISFSGCTFCPQEIEVLNDANGQSFVNLYGRTKECMVVYLSEGVVIRVSISYEREYVIAFAIVESTERGRKQ